MFPWSFISLTSLHHRLFFKPIRIFAVDINGYLDLISTNYKCYCSHVVPMTWHYDIRGNEWQVAFKNILLEMNLVAEGENDEMSIPNYRKRSRWKNCGRTSIKIFMFFSKAGIWRAYEIKFQKNYKIWLNKLRQITFHRLNLKIFQRELTIFLWLKDISHFNFKIMAIISSLVNSSN